MVALCEIGAEGHQPAIADFRRVRVDRWKSASQSQVRDCAPMVKESVFGEKDDSLRPRRYCFIECGREASSAADLYCHHSDREPRPRIPNALNERSILLKLRAPQDNDCADSRHRIGQKFEPFSTEEGVAECHSSVVSSWSRQTLNQTKADRVGDKQENHRRGDIRALQRER